MGRLRAEGSMQGSRVKTQARQVVTTAEVVEQTLLKEGLL